MIDRQSHVINSSDSDKGDISATLSEMAAVNLKDASAVEKKTFLKNKIIAAEKIKDLATTKVAARQYLELNNLTPDEKEFATSRLAWVEEMNLNFGEAFKLTKQLKMGSLSEDQRLQKEILLSQYPHELAEHYLYLLPWASGIARRKGGKAVRYEDAEDIGVIAFNEAVKKYEPRKGSFKRILHTIVIRKTVDFTRLRKNY
jgi:hypothetical protein